MDALRKIDVAELERADAVPPVGRTGGDVQVNG
jgi:hypothetical protein